MCGIIGITESNKDVVQNASRIFAYRGPDNEGYFVDERVSLGHHRLSVIDTDIRSNQPMWDAEKTICLVFNGEIYNYKELRQTLGKKYTFSTSSDTEVLLYAYKEYGSSFGEYVRGIFACAIYDVRKKSILLARDYSGVKPLYYSYVDGVLCFASELGGITSMWRQKNIDLVYDVAAVSLYSALGYVPSPQTIYKDIYKLEKSTILEFDLDNPKTPPVIKKFFPKVDNVAKSEDMYNRIEQSIFEQTNSDVPVGLLFSGGTDSSYLAAVLRKKGINLKTYSLKIEGRIQDEKYFSAISEKLGLTSEIYNFLVKEFDTIYEEVMSRITEPLADNSLFPTYYVTKQASKEVKVLLSGDGADEYFLGYRRHGDLYSMPNKQTKKSFWEYLYLILPRFKGKNMLFKKIFTITNNSIGYYIISMSPSIGFITKHDWMTAREKILSLDVPAHYYDRELYLENNCLKKVDQATSFSSVEGRVPFMDESVIINSQNFEREHIDGMTTKAFLKKGLLAYLPYDLVYRKKTGFGMDMKSYFRDSKYLRDDLDRALSFLRHEELVIIPKVKAEKMIEINPNYCLSLISLYRCIINNEQRGT